MSTIAKPAVEISVKPFASEIGQLACGTTYIYRFDTLVTNETNIKYPVINNYARKVEIIYLGKLKANHIFQLLCTEIDFLGKRLDSAPLLRKVSYVFDELILAVNTEGEIVKIENLKVLQSKWESTKTDLLKENEGSEVNNYLNSIDIVMYDIQKLIGFLSENKMYGLYFNGYWGKDQEPMTQLEKAGSENPDKGQFHYEGHQLMEAILEQRELHNHIKYNVLCLGLREF